MKLIEGKITNIRSTQKEKNIQNTFDHILNNRYDLFHINGITRYRIYSRVRTLFSKNSNIYTQSKLSLKQLLATVIFIVFLLFLVHTENINTLIIFAIAYLVIGVILFCYMLIEELQNVHTAIDPRPITYFDYYIKEIIIILNILCGISRITGSVMIILLITLIKTIRKRKDEEAEGALITENTNILIVNSSEENNRNRNTMGSQSFSSEEKDEFDMTFSLPKKEKLVKKVNII
jgi:hypothetical protein